MCSRIERLGRPLGDDQAAVHHDEPVAELFGLVHEVRRDHLRRPSLLQQVQAIPQDVASLRIESGRRLVE